MDCLTVFCTPCRRTGWRTRRAARCRAASPRQSGKAAKAPSSAPTSRCAAIIEAVKAALKIGAEVEKTVCKHKEARCPFYETCHYQAQKAPAKKADVVFAAHEILFQMVKALGKNFGLVVVDEGFWQDGLTGTRLATDRLDHELKAFPVRDHIGSKLDDETRICAT